MRYWMITLGLSAVIAVGSIWYGWQERRVTVLRLATGGETGAYYPFGLAIAEVVAQHSSKLQVEVIVTNGSQDNMNLLNHRKVDLALVQSDTPAVSSLRLVAGLYQELFHLMARADSSIQSVNDLKGQRIALMPKGSGSYDAFWTLAKHYNLRESDLSAIPMSPEEAMQAFIQGKVSATFRVLPLGNQWTRDLLSQTSGRLIALDQAKAMQVLTPYLEARILPKGVYQANPPIPEQDLPSVGVQALLVAHQEVKPEVVKELTTLLFSHRYELVKLDPKASGISSPDKDTVGLPLHPGAQSYYDREKPNFIIEHAEVLALLLSTLTLLFSGIWSLRTSVLDRQKNRADQYNLKLLELTQQASLLEDMERLEAIRMELFQIFRTVVQDLDQDRISPESFQSFSFTWEAAINIIQHRELIVLNRDSKQK
jgi:TRAP transporter TAXI family solute receptor